MHGAPIGIDPEEGPTAAEVTERARGVVRACPVRLFAVAQLDPEPPVVRVETADVGQDAAEPRELHGRRFGEGLARDQRRRLKLAGERDQIVERAVDVRGRGAAQLCAHPQGLEDGRAQVLRERHLRRPGDGRRDLLEAGVRVDPPSAGLRDGFRPFEREPRRVREQMANGGALRAGLPVEIDHALLGRDERRKRRRRLRDRGPAELHVTRTVSRGHIAAVQDGRRGDARAPAVDLPHGLHAARY
jgi:hypothetical protein